MLAIWHRTPTCRATFCNEATFIGFDNSAALQKTLQGGCFASFVSTNELKLLYERATMKRLSDGMIQT